MSPRAVAPEKGANLSAMRAVAIESAQSAIDHYNRQQAVSVIRGKVAVMAVALGTGGLLTWFWWAKGAPTVVMGAAVAAFVVAGFWAIQYVVLAGILVVRHPRHRNRHAASAKGSPSAGSQPSAETALPEPSGGDAAAQVETGDPPAAEGPAAASGSKSPDKQRARARNEAVLWRELENAASESHDEPPDGQ